MDVCHLTKDCIKENQIIYERRKVNKKATPFLTDKARIIINKYKDEALGDYVFSMNVNKTLKKVREKLTVKKQTAFRFDSELLDLLKSAAKREHRSLNNYVECLLREAMYREPNEETKMAIEEARSGKYAGTIDMSSFDSFMKSVNDIE